MVEVVCVRLEEASVDSQAQAESLSALMGGQSVKAVDGETFLVYVSDSRDAVEEVTDRLNYAGITAFVEETVRSLYDDGECPDCGEDIPEHYTSGDSCVNCEHVFTGRVHENGV